MLVKNTIIALMAVAPALSIPVPAAGTVATTKATTKATVATKASAVVQKVSGLKAAESKVAQDSATDKTLRAELKAADSKLAKDRSSVRGLERTQSATADKAARKVKTLKAPGSKVFSNAFTKALSAAHEKSSHRHTTTSHLTDKHHSSERTLKNKNGLRVHTSPHHIGGTRKPHSLTTPGSGRTGRLSSGPISGPISGPGTGFQSQFSSPSPWSGGIQSPPWSGGFNGGLNGVTEDINYTPKTGGGYSESVSWKQSPYRLARRATIPDTPTGLKTPVSPPLTPLGPFSALLQKHKTSKAAKHHQHTMTEALQLSQMLIEAEKVVNGLEEQMNKHPTVFHNLKRKSALKRLRAPTTPTTPVTPVTPVSASAVKST